MTSASHRIIAELLEARTGQHMSENRRWRVDTALAGLFREHGISNVDQLVCLLAAPGSERLAQRVVEALLNNETYFFRDRVMFDLLARQVLPALARKRADSKRIAIWSAGCSTGQEALSLAMMIQDQPGLWKDWTIDIVGTDISERAISTAREARYSQFEIQRGLGVGQMLSYFEETENGWKAKPALKTMVHYKVRNLLDPAEIRERFDLVLCRNVLLYFDPERRALAFDRLAESIRPDGWLMLGAGETAQGRTDQFKPVEGNQGLYVRSTPTLPDAESWRAQFATAGKGRL
ncbi:protein-glutamate O-methyltransferase CheR [Erythrobacter sp. HKB08]|uniref:CheR family methyltransferase n=1 Tax=Erythrobacter sp. HKB08 TaxID=2502843 RepID=UPI001F38FD84|nr:protein-glutamate O-methyltransferase CheR [Erythrobacter sp. HKB08]